MDLNFNLIREGDGGFSAFCLSHGILTHGATWGELCANIWEQISADSQDCPLVANVCFRAAASLTPRPMEICPASRRRKPRLPAVSPVRTIRSRRTKPGR